MTDRISAVILAGGSARRLGGIAKPFIKIDGKPIIERILSITGGLFEDFIIVTNDTGQYSSLPDCRITRDLFTGMGPLAGIHAGLMVSGSDAAFVFAGDMPFLDRRVIISMIEKYQSCGSKVLVPRIGEDTEPLHSLYHRSILGDLEAFLKTGSSRAVRDFIENQDFAFYDLDDTKENRIVFTNINKRGDLSVTRGVISAAL